MAMTTPEKTQRIDVQRQMKRYQREVKDLVAELVNVYGIRFKTIDGDHMFLYPPDGHSRPFKIASQRDPAQQVTIIHNQFIKRYMPEWRSESRPVTVAQEAPVERSQAEETPVAQAPDPKPEVETITIDGRTYQSEPMSGLITEVRPEPEEGEWVTHYVLKTNNPTDFWKRTINGVTTYWCQRCKEEGEDFKTTNPRVLGPHSGNKHNMDKIVATRKAGTQQRRVREAIEMIVESLDIDMGGGDFTAKEVEELIAEHEAERDRLTAERDEAIKERDAIKAKFDAAKAAFS